VRICVTTTRSLHRPGPPNFCECRYVGFPCLNHPELIRFQPPFMATWTHTIPPCTRHPTNRCQQGKGHTRFALYSLRCCNPTHVTQQLCSRHTRMQGSRRDCNSSSSSFQHKILESGQGKGGGVNALQTSPNHFKSTLQVQTFHPIADLTQNIS